MDLRHLILGSAIKSVKPIFGLALIFQLLNCYIMKLKQENMKLNRGAHLKKQAAEELFLGAIILTTRRLQLAKSVIARKLN